MFKTFKRKYINLTTDAKFTEILTGSIWALSARVLATGFGLVSSIIIARFYGADTVGIVAVLNSFLTLITVFTVSWHKHLHTAPYSRAPGQVFSHIGI